MRLINATALHPEWYGLHGTDLCNAYKMIDEAQTFDAVPVIRCKDCDHCIVNENHPDKPLICTMTLMCGTTSPDNFCWQGTPRVEHKPPEKPTLQERWENKNSLKFSHSDGSALIIDTRGLAVLDSDTVEKLIKGMGKC